MRSGHAIVYEQFGSLHLLNTVSGADVALDGDLPALKPHLAKISPDEIQNVGISPPKCALWLKRMATSCRAGGEGRRAQPDQYLKRCGEGAGLVFGWKAGGRISAMRRASKSCTCGIRMG